MVEKFILITGATDGIGKQTAIDLANMNYEIIVHGRNISKAKTVAEEIKETTGNENMHFAVADLAELRQIHDLAESLHQKYDRLDVLINNAGVSMQQRQLTPDGFEATFAINHLAHFLLTIRLLDLLKPSASGRIVTVASQAHASSLDFDNLQGERDFDGYGQYMTSKLCNIMFTFELAERLAGTGITANCLHPGVIDTKLLRQSFGRGMGRPVEEGSKTSIYLATSAAVESTTGEYFVDTKPTRPAKIAYDSNARKKLWALSEEMVGVQFEDIILGGN